jgi:hypothetical protein
MTIVAKGLCGNCYRVASGLQGEERQAALASTKNRITKKSVAPPAEVFKIAPAIVAEGTPVICISFAAADDRKIYDAVIEIAKRNRRDPEQQALWMLQQATGLSPSMPQEKNNQ